MHQGSEHLSVLTSNQDALKCDFSADLGKNLDLPVGTQLSVASRVGLQSRFKCS